MTTSPINIPQDEILHMAVIGLMEERKKIEQQIAKLEAELKAPAPERSTPASTPRRRLSATTRSRMAAGQKKRWDKYRKAHATK
jgi:hypothetical protein